LIKAIAHEFQKNKILDEREAPLSSFGRTRRGGCVGQQSEEPTAAVGEAAKSWLSRAGGGRRRIASKKGTEASRGIPSKSRQRFADQ